MLQAMAAHVLAHGLSDASLRPLAKAAGTSDRMLIYHFGNKEGLVGALLNYLGDLYSTMLDSMIPANAASSRDELLAEIAKITRGPQFSPFLVLWWDVVAGSARGNGLYRDSAQRIMQRLLDWVEAHLPDDEPDPTRTAREILTLIEGMQMLDTIGCEDIANAALARTSRPA